MSVSGEISSWDEEDGARVYRFDPAGSIAAGLAAVEARWRQDGYPQNAWAAANADASDRVMRAALSGAGFIEVFAQVEMEFELRAWQPPDSPGVVARAPERHELDRLWQLNEEVYRGRPYTGLATADDRRRFAREARDLDLWSVTIEGGDPVAFAAARIDGGLGWIDELSVHPSARRKGLGRGLLERSLGLLRARGIEVVRLRTDRDDSAGARTLYERVGFKVVQSELRCRKRLGALGP